MHRPLETEQLVSQNPLDCESHVDQVWSDAQEKGERVLIAPIESFRLGKPLPDNRLPFVFARRGSSSSQQQQMAGKSPKTLHLQSEDTSYS